jgi:hypothetical protein
VPQNYDLELPSTKETHQSLCCKFCNKYFPVKIQLKQHSARCRSNPKVIKKTGRGKKTASKRRIVESDEDEEVMLGPVRKSNNF